MAGLTPPAVLEPTSRPSVQSPSPSPSPTASPNPAQEEPLSVQAALDQLALILVQGVNNGDISRRAASEIDKEVEDVIKEYEQGELQKALEKLDELRGKVEELESKGQITPPTTPLLVEAIADVGAAMEANPPSPRSDGEGDGDDD
jgi:hypothetical protein